MATTKMSMGEWVDGLIDPKDVGQAEYSVIHSVLTGAVEEADDEMDRFGTAVAVLDEFVTVAGELKRDLFRLVGTKTRKAAKKGKR